MPCWQLGSCALVALPLHGVLDMAKNGDTSLAGHLPACAAKSLDTNTILTQMIFHQVDDLE